MRILQTVSYIFNVASPRSLCTVGIFKHMYVSFSLAANASGVRSFQNHSYPNALLIPFHILLHNLGTVDIIK